METSDVLIAGAGIIGLSAALEFASRGLKVTVIERGRAMAESSWAAAGMLAAGDPDNPPQLASLAAFSLSLYPEYLAKIEHLSGKKVPLRTAATLQSIFPHREPSRSFPKLSRSELHALEPALKAGGRDFILLRENNLDPRDLCLALPLAAAAAGVKLLENTPVVSADGAANSGSITIQTPSGSISAARFINCAGAWAESLALGRLPPGHPRIGPRKGQMVSVRLGREQALAAAALRHVIRTPEIYLVPRGDGRIAIGATVEHAGFDTSVHPQAIATLLRKAAELWPPIASAEVLDSWAGLRPGSADDLPLIGPTGSPGFWIAAGHFRNGILLAPGTARALAQTVLGETSQADLAAFDPARAPQSQPLGIGALPASDKRATATL